jgi:SAM-dependent methyltransferase
MLNLSKQERLRQRYRDMQAGWRPSLDIYTEMMSDLVDMNTRLLDAGCGPGGLVKDYVGKAKLVIGADRYAASFQEPAEIANLVGADLTALPFPNNTFDLIACSWVLEHLATPEATFREIVRVLKPGGHFTFITPNVLNYTVWMRRVIPDVISKRVVSAIYARNEDFINPTFYRANSPTSIERLLTNAGLNRVRLECIGDPTYLAFNEVLFRLTIGIERIIGGLWPQSRVHLVGLYRKRS